MDSGFLAQGTFAAFLAAYLGGLLTSLTPCVYPMIPVTIGVMGARHETRLWRALLLAGLFVMGLALVYSSLGFFAATTGKLLGSVTQKSYFIWGVALIFLGMGLGLLGLFDLRLPPALTAWLARRGGSGPWGSFILGMVSGCLAAPCSGPVVAAILAYVAARSNPAAGFLLLLVYSLGLGTPFLLLGALSKRLAALPRGGLWTEWIKRFCGLALIGAFYLLVRPMLPPATFRWLAVAGLAAFALFLPRLLPSVGGKGRTFHLLGRATALAAAVLILLTPPGPKERNVSGIAWLSSETEGLAEAGAKGKPIVMDFSADWCTACDELDRKTFADPRVKKVIEDRFVPVRIDATELTPSLEKLLNKYGIPSLPTVLFLAPHGQFLKDLTISTFVTADEFLPRIEEAGRRAVGCPAERKSC